MSVQIHPAAGLRALTTQLVEVLRDPLDDPMTPEWLAVPTEGTRRWLTAQLSRELGSSVQGAGDGIAANIDWVFPGQLRTLVLEATRAPDAPDAWAVTRLVWTVLDVLHGHADDPRLAPLAAPAAGVSCYARARRVADLFDAYLTHRPDMIRRWIEGDQVGGTGRRLDDAHRWQPELFSLVRARIAAPSPPELLPLLLDQVRTGSLRLALPARLGFVGIESLPGGRSFLDIVDAVSSLHEVHLFLLRPSPGMSRSVRDHVVTGTAPASLRADDRTAEDVRHPLVRSWAQPSREATVLLAAAEATGFSAAIDPPLPIEDRPATLLHQLQHEIRGGTEPSGSFRARPHDRSIQFHSCHGPTRQVEVLRDAILHLLADHPDLTEDQIVILTPDIETFGPLVEAVFGPSADRGVPSHRHDAPALSYRVTDRSLRDAYPMMAALASLVDLIGSRFSRSALLDFCALAPVRSRLGLDDEATASLSAWASTTAVRWGLDAEHRRQWGVPASYPVGTWRAALDRLLIGIAIDDDPVVLGPRGTLPVGVEGRGIELAGRLADLVSRLAALADEAARPRPVAAWCELLASATDEFLAPPWDAAWQRTRLIQLLGEIRDEAEADGPSTVDLELADVRRLLDERFGGSPGRADFFRGGITVSSLTPLRGVPFSVVCLLGLDEQAFGAGRSDGDDLIGTGPFLGDHDRRSDIRQALLNAVLAAGHTLVVTRTGHSIHTNLDVHRSVALAELHDAVLATVHPADRAQVDDRLETVHPRQPFDERNFLPGDLDDAPWGFDPLACDAAAARRLRLSSASTAPGGPFDAFLPHPLPDEGPPHLDPDELVRFLVDPTGAFLRRRMHLHLPEASETSSDELVTHVEPLDGWALGDRLLSSALEGVDPDVWRRRELAAGALPPGELGRKVLDEATVVVDGMLEPALRLGRQPGTRIQAPVDITLDDGSRLVGSVVTDGHHDGPPGPVTVLYSRFQAKYQIRTWLSLLALVATDPSVEWQASLICKGANGSGVHVQTWRPAGQSAEERRQSAREGLAVAVDCYRRGMVEPIPLYAGTSKALYEDDLKAARAGWTNQGGYGEGEKPAVRLVLGSLTLDELLTVPARRHDPDGPSPIRARRFAHHLWHSVTTTVTSPGREVAAAEEPT